MARWKVSFDPRGSPTGGPVAADIRERTAFAAGTIRALFRLADLRKCDQDRFTAPSAGTRSEPVRHQTERRHARITLWRPVSSNRSNDCGANLGRRLCRGNCLTNPSEGRISECPRLHLWSVIHRGSRRRLSGEVVTTVHRGSYDRLCAAHAAIQALSGSEMVHHGDRHSPK